MSNPYVAPQPPANPYEGAAMPTAPAPDPSDPYGMSSGPFSYSGGSFTQRPGSAMPDAQPSQQVQAPIQSQVPLQPQLQAPSPAGYNPQAAPIPGPGYPQMPIGCPQPDYGRPMIDPIIGPQLNQLRSHSTTCLVLGVLGIYPLGPFTSIAAWIWGANIEKRAAILGLPRHMVTTARVGKILGIIATCLWSFAIALNILGYL